MMIDLVNSVSLDDSVSNVIGNVVFSAGRYDDKACIKVHRKI